MAEQTRPEFDWTAIERDYRLGKVSNRELARTYGPSEAAIRQRAKAEGWVRNEAAQVRVRAQQKALERSVPRYIPASPESVEVLAEVAADVLVRHQKTGAVLAGLVGDLATQLHEVTHQEPALGEALEDYFAHKAAANPLMAHVYKQQLQSALHAIGLGTRSKTLLNLANAAAKVQDMERKSFNLDDDDQRAYEDLLAELHAKTQPQPD